MVVIIHNDMPGRGEEPVIRDKEPRADLLPGVEVTHPDYREERIGTVTRPTQVIYEGSPNERRTIILPTAAGLESHRKI